MVARADCVLFVEQLRTHIPRAAMPSAIAGVSLTFIALGFAVQIFAAPATAMVSMLLMLLFYGDVGLPFRSARGVIAVAAGWAIAVISGSLGYAWFSLASPEPTLPNTDGTGAIVPPHNRIPSPFNYPSSPPSCNCNSGAA